MRSHVTNLYYLDYALLIKDTYKHLYISFLLINYKSIILLLYILLNKYKIKSVIIHIYIIKVYLNLLKGLKINFIIY